MIAVFLLSACSAQEEIVDSRDVLESSSEFAQSHTEDEVLPETEPPQGVAIEEESVNEDEAPQPSEPVLACIPSYNGVPYTEINGNVPTFDEEELSVAPYESYSTLDDLGRCGVAKAMISPDMMPTEPRGPIGDIRPSGWETVKYDIIPDLYLYNRCHLIAYQLTGQNDNELNLITGTRYMNMEGMLWWENKVADYISMTGDDVLYRVTPCFEGDDLVARGVLMEAQSVSDNGISFCVFCHNVQPGIEIDYADGSSRAAETAPESQTGILQVGPDNETSNPFAGTYEDNRAAGTVIPEGTTYVFNTNSRKFHLPECDSVGDMKPKNTEFFDGTRDEAIEMGYEPCGRCNP